MKKISSHTYKELEPDNIKYFYYNKVSLWVSSYHNPHPPRQHYPSV